MTESTRTETTGNYDLLEKLGEGATGIVYRARHWETKEIIALKVLHAHIARNPVYLKRFEREFRLASNLTHPNIVKAVGFCSNGAQTYLSLEWIDGEPLDAKLERDGKMPEDEAIDLIAQVAEGLQHAHEQGLIHRDIKPGNIMVTRDGKAKILDLGLAKMQDGAELTRAGHGMGTLDFMAPEQFRDAKNVSVSTDIYALGATLYMMVTGHYPCDEEDPLHVMMRKLRGDFRPPRTLAPELSARVDRVIRRTMSPLPAQRPTSCREFVQELLGEKEIPDAVLSPPQPAEPKPSPAQAPPVEESLPMFRPLEPERPPVRRWTGTAEAVLVLVVSLLATLLISRWLGFPR
jgi:serine/threonine protein kinase